MYLRHNQTVRGCFGTPVSCRPVSQLRQGRNLLKCYARADQVPVRFRIRKKIAYGERFKVVGNQPQLGNWDITKALELSWHDGDLWASSMELPVGVDIEFKCVRVKGSSDDWEPGNNRKFKALGPKFSLDVRCTWGSTSNTDVHAHELKAQEPVFRELSSLQSIDHAAAEAEALAERDHQRREQERRERKAREAMASSGGSASSSYLSGTGSDTDSDDMLHIAAWQGKEVTFMRSNQHSNERRGRWDVSQLPSPPNPMFSIVKGDEKAPNWLKKLEVAKHVLVDEAERARPGLDALAASFIYLQWVTTGAIECVEGGGHYRPNHHARLAQSIFRSLEWVIEDDATLSKAATQLARKLSTRLPSFGEAFTQQVPLTRIRDIAHRNDIPSDLKQEIKHTLQNKLHRNAGPEDLVAAEAMLGRVTANPGQYSEAFVNEFRVFIAELRDFFNAASLTTLLEGVREALGNEDRQVIDFFLSQKAALDAKPSPSPEDLVATTHALTSVRALLMAGLNSGLRNDAPDSALAMRQQWRLSEVRCEDYAFVLLSRLINSLEEKGGSNSLLTAHDLAWAPCLGGLVLGLRHLGLGGVAPAEAIAIEAELTAWQKAGGFQDRDNALRLKATLERLQRLTEVFSEMLLELLTPTATALGQALGVAPHTIQTFTEAEIRAHVVFQVSKLTSLLLRTCRAAAGSSSWDPLVAGTAVGKLIELHQLDPAALASYSEPVVVLLKSASGDEEVAAVGPLLKGVVLAQDLPHLSHLGVRARQEKVPFAILDDPSVVTSTLQPLLNQVVALTVTPDTVSIDKASQAQINLAATTAAASGAVVAATTETIDVGAAAGVSKVSTPRLLQLLDCTPSLAGAKASACAKLEQVSLEAKGSESFQTARGACVPFGVMDLALDELPGNQQQRYKALLAASESAPLQEINAIADELQAVISSLVLPPAVLTAIQATFPPGSTLIARSSANVEDLAGLSGAGLYDSVPNVPVDRPEDISAAVAAVWASLYTRRAILSRRAAGVPQADACMAVLMQELLSPTYSFVLHTASPMGNDPLTAEVEIAAGLGETLASGKRGSAWRLAVSKSTGQVRTLAFANFSEALLPAAALAGGSTGSREGQLVGVGTASQLAGVGPARPGGLYSRSSQSSMGASVWSVNGDAAADDNGSSGSAAGARGGIIYECVGRVMDYSRHGLSQSGDMRQQLGQRIGAVAGLLERSFGGAQDVEGCLVGDLLHVVQTRPQP